MAWRPNDIFVEGMLDNTTPGKITGHMLFNGLKGKVIFALEGDFHSDIKGKKILLVGPNRQEHTVSETDIRNAAKYMEDFDNNQIGDAGDITATPYPYIEWYSEANGRVVLELDVGAAQIM